MRVRLGHYCNAACFIKAKDEGECSAIIDRSDDFRVEYGTLGTSAPDFLQSSFKIRPPKGVFVGQKIEFWIFEIGKEFNHQFSTLSGNDEIRHEKTFDREPCKVNWQ